ncbi:MAG: hypothetical protein L7R84_03575, partial [Balneolaceae bacterium]|nr:hypothetical protein [Balneolaceae bacterium]
MKTQSPCFAGKSILSLMSIALLFWSCSSPSSTTLTIEVDYLGDVTLHLEEVPLHYKYSEKTTLQGNQNGNTFTFELPSLSTSGKTDTGSNNTSTLWYHVRIQDQFFPLAIPTHSSDQPTAINIQVQRAAFPKGLIITDQDEQPILAYENFLRYQEEVAPLDQAISQQESIFTKGDVASMLELSQQKMNLAERLLSNGLYRSWWYRVQGEHLVREIRAIEFLQRFKGL